MPSRLPESRPATAGPKLPNPEAQALVAAKGPARPQVPAPTPNRAGVIPPRPARDFPDVDRSNGTWPR